MRWSWEQARRAAAEVRRAEFGTQVLATVRPRSVVRLVRCRLPLALLLYLASWDGLVVEQTGGGFAVLQRPSGSRPTRPGGYLLRTLRWLDRHWHFVVFGGPPALGLLAALAVALLASSPLPSLLLILAAIAWTVAFLGAGLVPSGARSSSTSRLATSLPYYHWFVPLLHQPDPGRVDELLRLLTGRLVVLMRDDLEASAAGKVRVDRPDVKETLAVLRLGITTEATRTAAAATIRAVPGLPAQSEVIMLDSPGRLEQVWRPPTVGGGFLVMYVIAFALAVAVWRFTDVPDLWLGAVGHGIFGVLVALAGAVGVLIAIVAGRAEIARNREASAEHMRVLDALTNTARVLILVTNGVERDAVLEAFVRRTGRPAVLDQAGAHAVHRLGGVAGAQVVLAQSGEQGTSSVAGMYETARSVIDDHRPDYIILTGICYGLRRDQGQRIGDVVVGRRVHNIDHRRLTETADVTIDVPRGIDVLASRMLINAFQVAEVTWPRKAASVHFGTLLCSNALADSHAYVQQLRTQHPNAIAGEMEAVGVAEAATTGSRPEWIVVKGISDWGHDKSDQDQPLAAGNAADFVAHVVAAGLSHPARRVAPARSVPGRS
jgi:nucleoside phosphorylase